VFSRIKRVPADSFAGILAFPNGKSGGPQHKEAGLADPR
jgi:hypothetical protein